MAFYAALRLGAIVIEHNPLYTPPASCGTSSKTHGAEFAIVWDKVADLVADFPSDLALEHIVAVDITRAMPFGTRLALRLPVKKARESRAQLTAEPSSKRPIAWEKLLTHGKLSRKHEGPLLDDIALLQYTSGTTGTPKGAISHAREPPRQRDAGARVGTRVSTTARRRSTASSPSSTRTDSPSA